MVPDNSDVSGLANDQTSTDAGFVTVSCSASTCCGVNADKVECSTWYRVCLW